MSRRMLCAMQAKGCGRIINIAGAVATQPIASGPNYGAAKAAMLPMTVSLASAGRLRRLRQQRQPRYGPDIGGRGVAG